MDGKHVVFGQVVADDLPHLEVFAALGSPSGLPSRSVVIGDCGQLAGGGFVLQSSSNGARNGSEENEQRQLQEPA